MQISFDVSDPGTYFDTSSTGVHDDGNQLLLLSGPLIDASILSYRTSDRDSTIIFDADRGFESNLLSFSTGAGDDYLYLGRFYIGSLAISSGAGDDVLILAHIEHDGSLDAGDGNDIIRIMPTIADAGIFGNGHFAISGGAGDDFVDIEGVQYNLLGPDINVVDGGAGFDTYVWNLRYDIGCGTDQTGVDQTQTPSPASTATICCGAARLRRF